MPISNKYKCLFIHIPKTGGTSIEAALEIFGDWKVEDRNTLFGLIQSPELKKLNFRSNFLQHLTMNQIKEITPLWHHYTSFSFVRNPWDKMVSIYSNPDNNLVDTAKTQGINLKALSFEDFIIQTGKIKHIHLEPQYTFICNNKKAINVTFLGKFESIQTDFNKLCSILGIHAELPHHNKSERSNYRDYYTSKTKKIIESRYIDDINIFDYSF